MEKKTIFRDRQELQASDFNNLEGYAADALQHVCQDAVSASLHYTGLSVAKASSTEATVDTGRFWNDGKVYAYPQGQTLNLFQYLPLVTKKVVAVVVWGQEIDTATEPRDFLIDLTNGTTEPQAVPMERSRIANVNLLPGAESADPQPPTIQTGTLAVAYIYLTPTGIERVEMQTGNKLPNLRDHEQRVWTLETWRTATDPSLSSLRTDLASLARRVENLATLEMLAEILRELDELRKRLNAPTSVVFTDKDAFANATKSNTGASGYAARIANGLLFPAAATSSVPLSVFNPLDPAVARLGGYVFPAYDVVPKLTTDGYAGDLQINTFQASANSYTVVSPDTTTTYAGTAQNQNPAWYRDNYFGQASALIESNSRVAMPLGANGQGLLLKSRQNARYISVPPPEPYSSVGASQSVNGALISQTFLVSNATWLTHIALHLTSVDSSGSLTIKLAETTNGKPDLNRVISTVTVQASSLSTYPTESRVAIQPTWLEPGKLYAVVLITEASHRVAVVAGDTFAQGTLFYGVDGNWAVWDTQKDLMFTLYGAQFRQRRTEITLQPLSLAGGLKDIWVSVPRLAPVGCSLSFEIQVAGVWIPLEDADTALSGSPALVGFRAVLNGTQDLAPCFAESATGVTVSRPADALVHYSATITPSASATGAVVDLIVNNFDGGNHTITCVLMDGASPVSPASTAITDTEDGRAKRYKYTFTSLGGLATFAIKIEGASSNGAAPFSISERVVYTS